MGAGRCAWERESPARYEVSPLEPAHNGENHTRPKQGPMHYPYLVSTTCVSVGIIAIGAVVSDWPGGSTLLQPCQHVLDGLPDPLVIHVSRGVACGSHAAAPAVLTITGGWQRLLRSSPHSGITCQRGYRCRPP
ncbi:MAG: hypothetical protein KatS3mg056_3715 [Chloroflexus sp.]|nr:MAG: hypothetical protein KatS3mg056_3715 [Chloroflexus sp.]